MWSMLLPGCLVLCDCSACPCVWLQSSSEAWWQVWWCWAYEGCPYGGCDLSSRASSWAAAPAPLGPESETVRGVRLWAWINTYLFRAYHAFLCMFRCIEIHLCRSQWLFEWLCQHLIGSVFSCWHRNRGLAYDWCYPGRAVSCVSSLWQDARLPSWSTPLWGLAGLSLAQGWVRSAGDSCRGVLLKSAGFQSLLSVCLGWKHQLLLEVKEEHIRSRQPRIVVPL